MSTLEIPTRLPVGHLSVSSVNTYLKCPEKWRRRYVERDYEAPSGAMILGGAVGAAEGHAYQAQIDTGERSSTAQVLDEFAAHFEQEAADQDVDWKGHKPGDVKDQGVKAIRAYDLTIAPHVIPTSVEREFELSFSGVEWKITGYLDLEEADGAVSDLKVKARKLSQAEADVDIQPTAYLLARRTEGKPAPEFRFHTMVKTKTPYAEVVPTTRTDHQLDLLADRFLLVAAEINWRLEYDVWQGPAPGAWWCSESMCGYWAQCPLGGAR